MPGFWELILLLVILVIVFGATRLPALGEAIGRSLSNYKAAKSEPPAKTEDPG